MDLALREGRGAIARFSASRIPLLGQSASALCSRIVAVKSHVCNSDMSIIYPQRGLETLVVHAPSRREPLMPSFVLERITSLSNTIHSR
jgi:hypothetical protein